MYARGSMRAAHMLDSMRGMVRVHGQDGMGWERVCQGRIKMACLRQHGGDSVGWERVRAWTMSSRRCRGDGMGSRWHAQDGAGEMAQGGRGCG